ncbi:MAG: 3-phosphoshikimate 1-carboxyvinyltransferase, partial [Candidatus Neomarinimicrobiota bacterium]|nr:3-phosphoshikimate 1-carboxyvinyltransferase [Candidatus Neomarinimicrobiota bacterium]
MGIVGTLVLPGDKSISHRALMLASISNKKSKLINLSTGKDVSSTISCLKNCGIEINKNGKDITIQGGTLRDPKNVLDCGNSGTTIRLLAGLLAGQGINATLVGDKSLSKRPMRRIIDPLMKMGVKISSKNNFAPITIEQSKMNPINYHSPIASAQVKSCILFAGMGVQGLTQINEPFQSRDHSEIMLQHLGASINVSKDGVSISKSDIQNPIDLTIPSDPSTAAFFIAASLMCKDSKLTINRLLLNETRVGFIKAVTQMGGNIKFLKT